MGNLLIGTIKLQNKIFTNSGGVGGGGGGGGGGRREHTLRRRNGGPGKRKVDVLGFETLLQKR